MAGRHEAGTGDTFDAVVDDYVTGRARELIRQIDELQTRPISWDVTGWSDEAKRRAIDINEWVGAAAEILRELTRDA